MSVHWLGGNGVMKVALAGGTATTFAPGQNGGANIQGIAVDAMSVYWIQGSAVMKVALGGGTPTTTSAVASY